MVKLPQYQLEMMLQDLVFIIDAITKAMDNLDSYSFEYLELRDSKAMLEKHMRIVTKALNK